MKYYLDTEFDGTTGEIISLGMVSEEGIPLYLLFACKPKDDWVIENVVPFVKDVPAQIHFCASHTHASELLEAYWKHDLHPHVICDWPTDFMYLSELLTVEPGTMINVPAITMEVIRVDAYPTDLAGAVQHNSYWDAMALKHKLEAAAGHLRGPEDGNIA